VCRDQPAERADEFRPTSASPDAAGSSSSASLNAATTAFASLTSADTKRVLRLGSSRSIADLPGLLHSCPVHASAICSAAPGTCRATRRMAETSWVTVS